MRPVEPARAFYLPFLGIKIAPPIRVEPRKPNILCLCDFPQATPILHDIESVGVNYS